MISLLLMVLSLAASGPTVILAVPADSGRVVRIREKYGPTIEIDSVNVVVLHDGTWYVTRAGKLRGAYAASNYSVEF